MCWPRSSPSFIMLRDESPRSTGRVRTPPMLRRGLCLLVALALAAPGLAQSGKKDKPKDAGKADAKPAEPKEVTALRARGANFELEDGAVVGVSFFKARITDADLAGLSAIKGLRSLDL